jgi:acetyl-CoA carboxylase carboxyltransferase component
VSALAERFTVVEEPRTLDAYGRLEALFDPGSLQPIRSTVLPRRPGGRSTPGDGVVAGGGTVAGRQVFAYAQDQSFAGGSTPRRSCA